MKPDVQVVTILLSPLSLLLLTPSGFFLLAFDLSTLATLASIFVNIVFCSSLVFAIFVFQSFIFQNFVTHNTIVFPTHQNQI